MGNKRRYNVSLLGVKVERGKMIRQDNISSDKSWNFIKLLKNIIYSLKSSANPQTKQVQRLPHLCTSQMAINRRQKEYLKVTIVIFTPFYICLILKHLKIVQRGKIHFNFKTTKVPISSLLNQI